ncbi:MAG: lysylphosphatidylglycerol synthase transmembrane domain-containing protein [Synergistaceae bacterium]|nr:lysylphosphatidylglycerol synthase transmembrane domain-containing protein [Synergistaceae bacterium]
MTVRKSFTIFICIVIVSIVSVLFLSIDSATFDVLENTNPMLLSLAILLVVLGWFLDACKFIFLARAAGEYLSLRQTISVVWINYFGSAITPMQSGGGPFQIYLLYKYGVSVGKSIAITLVRTLQVIFLLALVIPFSIVSEAEFIERHAMLKWFVVYVLVFIVLASFILVISIVRPQWIKRWSNGFLVRMKRLGILKPKLLLGAARWANREIDNYSTNIRLFRSTGRYWFMLSVLTAVVHLWIYLSIMPCLIMAAGFNVEYMQCMLAESLLLFLLYFVPTLGGSGAAEGGAAAVFGLFVPWNLAGVMAVAWRLVSEYSGIALGTVIAIRMLGWGGAEEVMKEETERLEDASQ